MHWCPRQTPKIGMPSGKRADDVVGQTSFPRRARTGRNQNAFRLEDAYLIEGNLVVATHLQVHTQLAQVLHEVVSERIVVIQDQNHFTAKKLHHSLENKRGNEFGCETEDAKNATLLNRFRYQSSPDLAAELHSADFLGEDKSDLTVAHFLVEHHRGKKFFTLRGV